MRARRTDANHRAVTAAIRALGYPVKSLHTQGGGVEDLLVGVPGRAVVVESANPAIAFTGTMFMRMPPSWILVEVKVPNKSGGVKPSKFTEAQKAWYAQTEGFPRLVVTSAQDAIDKLRAICSA